MYCVSSIVLIYVLLYMYLFCEYMYWFNTTCTMSFQVVLWRRTQNKELSLLVNNHRIRNSPNLGGYFGIIKSSRINYDCFIFYAHPRPVFSELIVLVPVVVELLRFKSCGCYFQKFIYIFIYYQIFFQNTVCCRSRDFNLASDQFNSWDKSQKLDGFNTCRELWI